MEPKTSDRGLLFDPLGSVRARARVVMCHAGALRSRRLLCAREGLRRWEAVAMTFGAAQSVGWLLSRIRGAGVWLSVATGGLVCFGWLMFAGSAAAALPPGCSEPASTITCSFSFTGAAQSFTVPSGVNSITVAAFGAQGGGSGAAGGLGGEAQAVFAVSPGAALEVLVAARAGRSPARGRALSGGSTVAAQAAMAGTTIPAGRAARGVPAGVVPRTCGRGRARARSAAVWPPAYWSAVVAAAPVAAPPVVVAEDPPRGVQEPRTQAAVAVAVAVARAPAGVAVPASASLCFLALPEMARPAGSRPRIQAD